MAQPTHSEVQAVDPILSNLLVGYMQSDTRFVADKVFPVVNVDKQGFTYYQFTKKYFFSNDMKPRAVGGSFARGGFGASSTTGQANLFGLEFPIADEAKSNNQTPMSLEQAGLMWLAQNSLINREQKFAADFMTTGVWGTDDNNAATDWDSTGSPVDDILTAKMTISNNTGFDADTMVVGYITHKGILGNANIADRIRYVQGAGITTIESALLSILGIKNYLVSKATYNTANEGQAFSGSAIIDDDALIMASSSAPGIMSPNPGYTFAWAGGGGVGQIATYQEPQTKSNVLQLSEAWDQKLVASDLGYFFADIV